VDDATSNKNHQTRPNMAADGENDSSTGPLHIDIKNLTFNYVGREVLHFPHDKFRNPFAASVEGTKHATH